MQMACQTGAGLILVLLGLITGYADCLDCDALTVIYSLSAALPKCCCL